MTLPAGTAVLRLQGAAHLLDRRRLQGIDTRSAETQN